MVWFGAIVLVLQVSLVSSSDMSLVRIRSSGYHDSGPPCRLNLLDGKDVSQLVVDLLENWTTDRYAEKSKK
jgi:hypothetical protein